MIQGSIHKTAQELLSLPSPALKGYFKNCKGKAAWAINKTQKYVERKEWRDKRVGITSYFQSLEMTRQNWLTTLYSIIPKLYLSNPDNKNAMFIPLPGYLLSPSLPCYKSSLHTHMGFGFHRYVTSYVEEDIAVSRLIGHHCFFKQKNGISCNTETLTHTGMQVSNSSELKHAFPGKQPTSSNKNHNSA